MLASIHNRLGRGLLGRLGIVWGVGGKFLFCFLLHRLSAPLKISYACCGIGLGLTRSLCGVESLCDTLHRAGREWRWPGPLFGCFWQVICCQKQWCARCFSVYFGDANCMLIYFCEHISRVCLVMMTCYCLVVYTDESWEAATSSRFFDFLLRMCKVGLVLQSKGGEH